MSIYNLIYVKILPHQVLSQHGMNGILLSSIEPKNRFSFNIKLTKTTHDTDLIERAPFPNGAHGVYDT